MILAHRILLQPTPAQARVCEQTCDVCRVAWNWALRRWGEMYGYGGRGWRWWDWWYQEPRKYPKPSRFTIDKQWTKTKKSYPEALLVDSQSPKRVFAELETALRSFWKGNSEFPTPKRRSDEVSFYIPNTVLKPDGRHIHVAKIGAVRMRLPLRLTGKIMGARVSRRAGRWYVSIQVDVGEYRRTREDDRRVGIDLGIGKSNAVVVSDGEVFEAPRSLASDSPLLRRLKRLQRVVTRRKKGSANRAKAIARVAKLQARIGDVRSNFQHQTTARICRTSEAIAIEDLTVSGMVKNHKMARAVSDAGMAEIRRQLEYKAVIFGTDVVVADKFFASTQTCSRCGSRKRGEEKLGLGDRMFHCDDCGHESDRDMNAAQNLSTLLPRVRQQLPAVCGKVTPEEIREAPVGALGPGICTRLAMP